VLPRSAWAQIDLLTDRLRGAGLEVPQDAVIRIAIQRMLEQVTDATLKAAVAAASAASDDKEEGT
jgi:hypothetical protein